MAELVRFGRAWVVRATRWCRGVPPARARWTPVQGAPIPPLTVRRTAGGVVLPAGVCGFGHSDGLLMLRDTPATLRRTARRSRPTGSGRVAYDTHRVLQPSGRVPSTSVHP
ncbi:hypothetical protein Sxan_24700 [Streptomyces xanthophaeus]|uniref:Uncharacterized protein n=1 Tax=Streptomyces xanthophaeus TaxID=67385 RepID=A0A919GYP1_9ACTN|nr:hypothetical protein Sxan_24700 [Streptomyces xanthophaeus]